MENKNQIMAHLIAGYPDVDTSFEIAKILIRSGICALEIQFPFSDPTADGPAIEKACSKALEKGFKVDGGFALVKKITSLTDIPVFIMTYGSIVFARGIERFVKDSADSGAEGVIVPDMLYDNDEGLGKACRSHNIEFVPVIVSSMKKQRIEKVIESGTGYIYAALRSGTTGAKTVIDDSCISFLENLKKSRSNIMAGFGLRSKDQIRGLEGLANYFIVGSALVNMIADIADIADNKYNTDKAGNYNRIGDYIKRLL
ncbi:MAG: tryptophan synthase subunit alpha [Spirochaetia bacterium]|nr:tryptophan synthase subunit alpha [Spirochaetia bacterium]